MATIEEQCAEIKKQKEEEQEALVKKITEKVLDAVQGLLPAEIKSKIKKDKS